MHAKTKLSTGLIKIAASLGLAACGGSSSSSSSSNSPSSSVAAKYCNAVVPIVKRSLSQLEALKPDSSVAADWNA